MANRFHEGDLVRCVNNKKASMYEKYLLCGKVVSDHFGDLYVNVISRSNYEEMGSNDSGSNWYMDRDVLTLIESIECDSPLASMFE
jgi:hypothetical protein